jgi:hypothetical protein
MMTEEMLKATWDAHFPQFPLSEEKAGLWLAIHTDTTLTKGLNVIFSKWERDSAKMDEGYLMRYANKTLNNMSARLRYSTQAAVPEDAIII